MSARLTLRALIVLFWVFLSVDPGSAGVFLPPEAGATGAAPGGFRVLAGPAQPFTFLDALSISSIGESGYGLSGVGVPGFAASHGAATELTGSRPLSDEPKSYLFSFEKGEGSLPYIGLGRVDRLDLAQVNRVSLNEYRAELMIGYKVTGSGSILFGRAMQLESPSDTSLRFQDDGWRLKFIKSF